MTRAPIVALLVACLPAVAFAELTEQESRGRQIYQQGTSATGAEIVALVGDARTEVPASILPCGGCHGAGGHGAPGQPRSDLAPANLTWPALSQPSGAGGRRPRPAYSETSLKSAITRGVDAGGNRLHVTMPRYRLTTRDAEDLIAYLRRLGDD